MALTTLSIRKEREHTNTSVPSGTSLWLSNGLRLIEDQYVECHLLRSANDPYL